MTAPTFLPGNQPVAVIRAAVSFDDRYGATTRTWATATSTLVLGCVVQTVATEENDLGREYAATHMQLYAPATIDIQAADRVLWNGQTFEVDGPPVPWFDDDGQPHHVEATLKRLTG